MIVDAGSFCTHNFGQGSGYTFTGIGISFAHKPEHGRVAKAGDQRFIYTPDKGFTGKDAYVFHICATKGGQKGCSTVAFVSQVK